MSTKTIEFDGETYTVAENVFDDVEVLEAFEDEKNVAFCRAILGPTQWRQYKAKKRDADSLYRLLNAILVTEGVEDEAKTSE